MKFQDATIAEIDQVMQEAWEAFLQFRKTSLKERADLMRAIATGLEAAGDELIHITMEETHLPETRLRNERARTMFQLTSYADACEAGHWLEARIDVAVPEKNDPDIRKMQVPLGPVVVFGASNFPFAYSTAGGDTASALAAGCPVIVKAHPAHAGTSEMVAQLIHKAVQQAGLPKGVFAHVHGAGFETGKALVTHPNTRAVGFTGSFGGGKALFDWANQRKEPIPVFAEMGSINPVFLLPGKLKTAAKEVATMYAGSITMGTGQFCTNPGLIIGLDNADLDAFVQELGSQIRKVPPGTMLHPGIAKAFAEKRAAALGQEGVMTVAVSETKPLSDQGEPTIASASGKAFFNNPLLHQEVFGPYSLVIRCADMDEMTAVARHLEGQLTTTLMATESDIVDHPALVDAVQNICGRFILNGVPTGVRVGLAMQHGGPFPATTDSRFTSVGADGIKRWVRPLAFQNWPDALLPDALKDSNPLGIWRIINDTPLAPKRGGRRSGGAHTFFCIDAHTCGNPVRLVAAGGPVLKGNNMSEKRQHFLREYDWIRKGLMFEPRGHDMMSGSILYPPHDPENDVAVLFIETSGCLPMCGHGTIGTITIALEEGLIRPKTPGLVRMEAPAGLVLVEYEQVGDKVKSVKLTNVPAYLAAENITVECPDLGMLHVDVSYGGNFYAIVDLQENFKGLEYYSANQLVNWSRVMRERINAQHAFIHPENPTIHGCSHILWTGKTISPEATARNAVFYGDKAIDRSPCGTGTSARMAQWYAKGKLKEGDIFIHESIIGSQFTGKVEKVTSVAGKPAIIPSIQGWARIYGYNTISIDPQDDPYAYGFQVL